MPTASELLGDGYVDVPADVAFIGQRIMAGDATLGWRGDPSMSLMFNPHAPDGRVFEVWGVDARRRPYIVARYDSVGPRILADLAASDWQNGPALLDRYYEGERKKAERKKADQRDQQGELVERMQWAINRSFRHLTGGRVMVGQVGGGSKKGTDG